MEVGGSEGGAGWAVEEARPDVRSSSAGQDEGRRRRVKAEKKEERARLGGHVYLETFLIQNSTSV